MKNVTLAIEEEVLAAARVYAAKHNTTVNGLVRDYLKRLATQEDRAANARKRLVELSERSQARLPDGWNFNREEIYDRPILSRHQNTDLRGFAEEGGGMEKKDSGGSD
ncbi:MAG: DUF6364 family protein [Hyphomicrobiales bacterium]|nr:DUF6364 family protein [Hyphomicrobiales bacterium]